MNIRWGALLFVPGGVALLAGVNAGLLLLGLPAPVTTDRLPVVHGTLLTLGFVGTVIALERAVALRRGWAYLAPAALGSGGLALVSPAPLAVGQGLFVAGTAGLLAIYAALWRRQESAALALQVFGAAGALGGALLWWGGAPVATALPWLVVFLVLTISGERLELARVAISPRIERTVLHLGAAVLAAAVAATLWPGPGAVALGLTLVALTAVLVRHDVARRTVRSTGLTRYMAVCLLAAYAWAFVGAGIWLLLGPVSQGPAYDAVIHAFFLGYTISMIMAHAPVILPAVVGRPLPYAPVLYLPVALLHGSLALRVIGGDRLGSPIALEIGGALNVAAVLLFVVLALGLAVRAARRSRGGGTEPAIAAGAPVRVPEEVTP